MTACDAVGARFHYALSVSSVKVGGHTKNEFGWGKLWRIEKGLSIAQIQSSCRILSRGGKAKKTESGLCSLGFWTILARLFYVMENLPSGAFGDSLGSCVG